jgi:hypothetical protein
LKVNPCPEFISGRPAEEEVGVNKKARFCRAKIFLKDILKDFPKEYPKEVKIIVHTLKK